MKRMARDEKLIDAAEQLIYERGFHGVGATPSVSSPA
jgi:AcrR family transcriptional regulator